MDKQATRERLERRVRNRVQIRCSECKGFLGWREHETRAEVVLRCPRCREWVMGVEVAK